jgi:hypothetical protein
VKYWRPCIFVHSYSDETIQVRNYVYRKTPFSIHVSNLALNHEATRRKNILTAEFNSMNQTAIAKDERT